jgi:glycogen operon protein
MNCSILTLFAAAVMFSCQSPILAPNLVSSNTDQSTHSRADRVGQKLGAIVSDDGQTVDFSVYSEHATRIEVWVYQTASGQGEVLSFPLTLDANSHIFSAIKSQAELSTAVAGGSIYYGYRAWGPNWAYDTAWNAGSEIGFLSDVDDEGNRFNPNKLLLDPYALEMSHDPLTGTEEERNVFASGPGHRQLDSARLAPKGIVLPIQAQLDLGNIPTHPLKDDVIYEVHLRGFTKNDASIPAEIRGTYAGAARKARYLKDLGITAVEFLPLQETQNDGNDFEEGTAGDNYWGYMTLAYFAPDRRYSSDRSPGGPTKELQMMVKAFHDEGIKVFIDVVYNHTGEGGLWDDSGNSASLYSFRGLDNQSYYELTSKNRLAFDNTGVGGNFNAASTPARDFIVNSVKYWHEFLGIDGFRFDLAPILGNECKADCFNFDKLNPDNALNRLVRELPARPDAGGIGVELIAEPWAIGNGTFQVGNFPAGWAEWNGQYRDTIRTSQNLLGVASITPATVARSVTGSSNLFQDDGRKPQHSINFLTAHDGLTLSDLYSCNSSNNKQSWPFGPSDGGTNDNVSWDHGGIRADQEQAARTGMAILILSSGVPMLMGGDEFLRSQRCNNNAYNLDSVGTWFDWNQQVANQEYLIFTKSLISFRRSHPALKPASYFNGSDHNGNGLKDITWYSESADEAGATYMDNPANHFLAWRLDGTEGRDSASSLYIAYNGSAAKIDVTLPNHSPGKNWYKVVDTSTNPSAENLLINGEGSIWRDKGFPALARSLIIFVER